MGFIRICNLHCLTFGKEKYVEENVNNLFIINFGNILNKEIYIYNNWLLQKVSFLLMIIEPEFKLS